MTLAEAEAAERAAVVAIGELGEREIAAVKAWVASDCEGRRPVQDMAARQRLGDQLVRAIEAREALEKNRGP